MRNITLAARMLLKTPFVTAITIGIALIASHWLGEQDGVRNAAGHDGAGLIGTAVATMATRVPHAPHLTTASRAPRPHPPRARRWKFGDAQPCPAGGGRGDSFRRTGTQARGPPFCD